MMTKAEKKRALPLYAAFLKDRPLSSPPFVFRDRSEAQRQFVTSIPEGTNLDRVVLSGFWDPMTGKVHSLPRNYKED